MPDEDRLQLVRQLFTAFAAGDRSTVESIIAEDFTFSTPLDVGLDRAGYFERCWPGAGNAQDVEFVRLLACGDDLREEESRRDDRPEHRDLRVRRPENLSGRGVLRLDQLATPAGLLRVPAGSQLGTAVFAGFKQIRRR
jgi:hypothetical protein